MDINTVNNKIMVIYHGFIFFIENVFKYKFLTMLTELLQHIKIV